jgi:SAM-dependent methyltransferase
MGILLGYGAQGIPNYPTLHLRTERPMSEMPDTPVTLAEIARIAGVGRAAVSNWRRRHPTFPGRVGGSDASPLFSLADVEAWLIDQGKVRASSENGLEWLWPQFDAFGDRAESGMAIAAAALRSRSGLGAVVTPPDIELSTAGERLVDQTIAIAERVGARETFDFLLGRWQDANVRQVAATPPPLARLMVAIAAELSAVREENHERRTILDPACGIGGLLAAAATEGGRSWTGQFPLALAGVDREPVMAALATARLGFLQPASRGAESGASNTSVSVDVLVGDSLRADPHHGLHADVVLCNPPYNDRDWGYEELATDSRWTFGLPPRTESELAWVQHAVSKLTPGGVAVIVLPPAVAARKAGRRIRGELARSGVLRALVALPAGSAPPYSVPLHLWVLQTPGSAHQYPRAGRALLLVDAGDIADTSAKAEPGGIDWESLHEAVVEVMTTRSDDSRGRSHTGSAAAVRHAWVPLIDLLDDEVDLTPARHVPADGVLSPAYLADSWTRLAHLLSELDHARAALTSIGFERSKVAPARVTSVGELVRAGVLRLKTGQLPPEGSVRGGPAVDDAVPVLTIPDLLMDGEPSGWLPAAEIAAENLVTAEHGDVVVGGMSHGYFAWVEGRERMVLSAQIHALEVDSDALDPWFLAGSLRAPANVRQAGTHASSSARVDVRKLQVRQLPLENQRHYGDVFRRIAQLESEARDLSRLVENLARELRDGLASGQLFPGDR